MTLSVNLALIPLDEPGQAVNRGWTSVTGGAPVGVTWHWTATSSLAKCRELLGGRNAERKGEASAHYAVGRSREEGIDQYVLLDNRSWHAGINQTLQWDGKRLTDGRFKAARTTIGVETVNIGYQRGTIDVGERPIEAADATGRFVMTVQRWPSEQIAMMIDVGREIVRTFPHIRPDDHHGHMDICPGYKQDVAGFPFAEVLSGIYPDASIEDVWTPYLLPVDRQNALKAVGFDPGPVDGIWGRRSDGALRAFQRRHGLHEDGMWTVFVSRAIHRLRPSGPPPPPPSPSAELARLPKFAPGAAAVAGSRD